jgi:hypothetical protein
LAEAFAGLDLPLFKLGQFFVQVQMVEVQLFACPLLLADGRGGRVPVRQPAAPHGAWLRCFSALVQQLLGGIEHLQAGATAHHAAGHAQLSMADAEAGLAMWALGNEAIAHAAIRIHAGVLF